MPRGISSDIVPPVTTGLSVTSGSGVGSVRDTPRIEGIVNKARCRVGSAHNGPLSLSDPQSQVAFLERCLLHHPSIRAGHMGYSYQTQPHGEVAD